jgi:hypothetical protein
MLRKTAEMTAQTHAKLNAKKTFDEVNAKKPAQVNAKEKRMR